MKTNTRPELRRLGPITGLVVAVVLLIPGIAQAGEITVSVGAPSSAEVGSTVEVTATVVVDGRPVIGAEVSLSYLASFGGVEDLAELDRATTGDDGVAVLSYEQRAADNGEMRVQYLGPEQGTVAPAVFTIAVDPGGVQQYRSQVGVTIPWLSDTVVIGLITLLWSVIAFSAFQLVLIGRRGERPVGALVRSEVPAAAEEGSVWIGTLLAFAALITATGMVIVFVRSPLTHGNLSAPGHDGRTPVGFLGEEYPYTGFGLAKITDTGDPVHDGSALWIRAGCAACHGLSATGGSVGPDVSDLESLSDFSRDARRGPDAMPGYAAATLSDTALAQIYQWLDAGSPAWPHP